MRLSLHHDMTKTQAAMSTWLRQVENRLEKAALVATDRAASQLQAKIRDNMKAAGLGNLGNAIGMVSDLRRRRIKRYVNGGFSASGFLYVRTRNERTVGALISYTQGARILPKRGRWLWFPTDEIQRYVGIPGGKGRERLTPALWEKRGLDRRIGTLTLIKSVNGYPLLIVKNVGVDLSGRKRSAKSLTKSGRARKGQMAKEMIVAFIGIPFTSRAVRVDVRALHAETMNELPALMREALGRI